MPLADTVVNPHNAVAAFVADIASYGYIRD